MAPSFSTTSHTSRSGNKVTVAETYINRGGHQVAVRAIVAPQSTESSASSEGEKALAASRQSSVSSLSDDDVYNAKRYDLRREQPPPPILGRLPRVKHVWTFALTRPIRRSASDATDASASSSVKAKKSLKAKLLSLASASETSEERHQRREQDRRQGIADASSVGLSFSPAAHR